MFMQPAPTKKGGILGQLLARFSPSQLAEIGRTKRVTAKPRPVKAAPRPATTRARTAAPRPPIEKDNGDRLMGAQQFAREARRAAASAVNRFRNAPGAVGKLAAAVRQLPAIPTAGHTLREWRHFAVKVEAARPAIERLMKEVG